MLKNAKFAVKSIGMISIIICSANNELLASAKINIEKTIGVPFEVLSYENSKGEFGICSIYNKGAKAAKFDILCFMHEDLDIKTADWGEVVLQSFKENENLGVMGVVGCSYKTLAPSGWEAQSLERKLLFYNYIQRYKFSDTPSVHFIENPDNARISKVVSVDGMWFCTRKTIFDEFSFDEKLFKGFHCYDLDFCFQVGRKYAVAVTFEILIEHFSEGNFKEDWWTDTIRLHRKWRKALPMSVDKLPLKTQFLIEKRAYRSLVYLFTDIGYSKSYLFSLFLKLKRYELISWQQYFKINYFIATFSIKGKK